MFPNLEAALALWQQNKQDCYAKKKIKVTLRSKFYEEKNVQKPYHKP